MDKIYINFIEQDGELVNNSGCKDEYLSYTNIVIIFALRELDCEIRDKLIENIKFYKTMNINSLPISSIYKRMIRDIYLYNRLVKDIIQNTCHIMTCKKCKFKDSLEKNNYIIYHEYDMCYLYMLIYNLPNKLLNNAITIKKFKNDHNLFKNLIKIKDFKYITKDTLNIFYDELLKISKIIEQIAISY